MSCPCSLASPPAIDVAHSVFATLDLRILAMPTTERCVVFDRALSRADRIHPWQYRRAVASVTITARGGPATRPTERPPALWYSNQRKILRRHRVEVDVVRRFFAGTANYVCIRPVLSGVFADHESPRSAWLPIAHAAVPHHALSRRHTGPEAGEMTRRCVFEAGIRWSLAAAARAAQKPADTRSAMQRQPGYQ